MKLVLKIFNSIILALSLVAGICLFAVPTVSFNSNIALDVQRFSQFVPQTEYTDDIEIANLLGTDTIHVGISFKLTIAETNKVMNGNRDIINDDIISKNVDDIVATLHEPVDLITDFSIRSVIKDLVESEITKQIESAIAAQPEGTISSTAEDIKSEAGMDDAYFNNFARLLYNAANEDNATADSLTEVLFDQIDEALTRADFKSQIDKTYFDQDATKEAVRTNLTTILNELELIQDDGTTIKKISQISYLYLSNYLKQELQDKVADPTELDQQAGETSPDYADRLLGLYVLNETPDMVYTVVGYVAMGLYIGLFVFAALWALLFVFAIIRLFSNKRPWVLFGPWFWIIGSLQLVLGIGLTVFGKFILPNVNISLTGLPLKQLILAPRTYALIPSIIFVACIFIGIANAIIKGMVKRKMREEQPYQQYPSNNDMGGYY